MMLIYSITWRDPREIDHFSLGSLLSVLHGLWRTNSPDGAASRHSVHGPCVLLRTLRSPTHLAAFQFSFAIYLLETNRSIPLHFFLCQAISGHIFITLPDAGFLPKAFQFNEASCRLRQPYSFRVFSPKNGTHDIYSCQPTLLILFTKPNHRSLMNSSPMGRSREQL